MHKIHVTWGDKEDTDTQEGHIAEDTDTQEGQIASVKDGYKYQLPGWKGISPEPQLYKCNTKSLPVNIAKIVHTSWISFYDRIL